MVFIVGFYNDKTAPHLKGAYTVEEVEVPEMWLDDPICWVEHLRPRPDIRVVLCAPKEGWDVLSELVRDTCKR